MTDPENLDVVIVDDDIVVLEQVKRLFRGTKYSAHCFSDELAALEYMKSNRASILIVDQRMPHINGLDLLKELQESNRVGESSLYLYSAAEIPSVIRESAENSGITTLSKNVLVNRDDFLSAIANKNK